MLSLNIETMKGHPKDSFDIYSSLCILPRFDIFMKFKETEVFTI